MYKDTEHKLNQIEKNKLRHFHAGFRVKIKYVFQNNRENTGN